MIIMEQERSKYCIMEQKDTRRINWLLIKQSWSWYNKAGEFNEALGVNNNVYYDIQKGQAIDVKVIKRISNKTGISEDVLNGRDLLPMEGIKETKWVYYIKLLNQLYSIKEKIGASYKTDNEYKKMNDKAKGFQADMEKRVLGEVNNAKEGSVWYDIGYFCKNRTKFRGLKSDIYINNLINALEKVSWELVQSLQEKGLIDRYREKIYEQNEMLKAIVIYNKLHTDNE